MFSGKKVLSVNYSPQKLKQLLYYLPTIIMFQICDKLGVHTLYDRHRHPVFADERPDTGLPDLFVIGTDACIDRVTKDKRARPAWKMPLREGPKYGTLHTDIGVRTR